MNYKIIKIGNEEHPIKFGFNALRKYSKLTNTTLQELDKLGEKMTLDNALILMYCGIEDGYRAAKQEMKLDVDGLADLVDSDFDANTNIGIVKREMRRRFSMETLGEMMSSMTKSEKKQKPKQAKN